MSQTIIDLRSDTVTKPSAEMKEAMFNAEVGDDVFAEDISINALEEKVAKMFGHEAAIFCPSGTMTNQIAINVHTQPGDEVICHKESHIYRYEGGGIAANSGVQPYLLEGARGKFSLEAAQEAVHPGDSHYPKSALLAIENTTNRGGGATWDWKEVKRLSDWAKSIDMPFHVDGARIFNALVASKTDAKVIGPYFDSISVCFSKGLGCPVGSALIGTKEFVTKAHRIRKRMGGGMRQAGYLAKACEFALDNNINRLSEDHDKAKSLAKSLAKNGAVKSILPVETNIVIFETENEKTNQAWLSYFEENAVACFPFSKTSIRFVSHLDVSPEQIYKVCQLIEKFSL